MKQFEYRLRVRYQETDGQGHVHHANYLTYFEQARVEMLRAIGQSYRDVERSGAILVVSEMDVRYHSPAYFDDELVVEVTLTKAKGARMEHEYQVFRAATDSNGTDSNGTDSIESEPIVTGRSIVACLNHDGRPRRLPDSLRQHG
jgi:acyl-CoA thioester hydrolase